MSKKSIYSIIALIIVLFFTWMLPGFYDKNEAFSETVKISLREVGHQLLLANQDTTSLILPVIELKKSKYKLSFQNALSFEPSSLVSFTKTSFQKLALPEHYRVEVIQCTDQEVAYSYEMNTEEEHTIIPCAGRFLPKSCYTIEVKFIGGKTVFSTPAFLYVIIIIVFLAFQFFLHKRKQAIITEKNNGKHTSIGSFKFYPEQNKLVKEATEIGLSKKECELLTIFVAKPNQIIKRDELTKKVWEDNGVFVSRSLDTYISKLRKKLKDDSSIKLVNVHGVGYKLMVKY